MAYRGHNWLRFMVAAVCVSAAFLCGSAFAQGPVLSIQPAKTVQPLAGNGTQGYSGDMAAATGATLAAPSAVAYDAAGDLYIADSNNHVVREVDTTGKITTVAGNAVQGFSGDGGAATSASLDTPTGVAVDSNGNLYIADSHNQRIRVVSSGVISTFAGNGTAGFSGDGGSATQASLSLPTAVAVDSAGNVYIADTDNHRIRKVSGGVITTVAGDGEQIYSGDNGAATAAGLDSPTSVAVDAAGNLYIADSHNETIRKVDTNGIITTIAGNHTLGFSGDGSTATQAALADPTGVAVDAQGNVYVTDSRNNVVRQISNGVINTIAGSGAEGYSSASGPATAAVFDTPRSLAVNAMGNIAVADRLDQSVAAINLPSLAFGSQAVGTTSTAQSITLLNSGSASLQVQTIGVANGFQVVSGGTCSSAPITLSAGSSCTLSLAFAPSMMGVAGGVVTLNGAGIVPQTLLLSGTGTQGSATLQLSGASSDVYGSGTLTASASSGSQTATGTITFSEGSTVLGTVTLNNDAASLSLSTLSAGTHVITARYSGDANYGGATSAPFTVTVTPLQLTATAAAVTSVYGVPVPAITGTLSGVLPQDAGNVSAVFTTTATTTSPVGTYPITVALTGAAAGNYTVQLSASGADTLTILRAGTTTTLSVNSTSITPGQDVVLTAQVASATTGTPSGTVNFYDGTSLLGTVTLSSGSASYTAAALSAGATHTLTAVYSGATNFTGSNSTSSVTVAVAPLDFTMTLAGPSNATVVPGGSIQYQVTVTPLYGSYAGTVNFTVSGLPPGATVTFSPSTIPANGGTQTITITIQTAAVSALRTAPSTGHGLATATLAMLLFGGVVVRRRERRLGRLLCLLVLFGGIAITAVWSGCGSRNGFFAQPVKDYNVTITATGGGLQHSTTVTLQVQ